MKSNDWISVSRPDLSTRERDYLLAAFDSSWISSTGPFVTRFEEQFARFVDCRKAVSCVNGNAALHLALLSLGVGPGDEVVVPDVTYIATANAVRYVGAQPVLADCDPRTWTLDPRSVSRLITERTRAIILVHLLGVPADVEAIRTLAKPRSIALVEDAAEAHGAAVGGKPVGSLSDVSVFSFYANKVIATGEGGMVCTSRDDIAERVRLLRGQGARPDRTYWFDEIGYNYRMTNLTCAIGLAQLERFAELRAKREAIRKWYDDALSDASLPVDRQQARAGTDPVLWMYGIILKDECPISRDEMREKLRRSGIETRPLFPALHTLPIYADCHTDGGCTVSRRLGERGIMLPTHTQLRREDVRRVVASLEAALVQTVSVL